MISPQQAVVALAAAGEDHLGALRSEAHQADRLAGGVGVKEENIGQALKD